MNRFQRDLGSAERLRAYADLVGSVASPHALRTSRWERTSRGLYVADGTRRAAPQRVLSAAALLPPDGWLGGWAAALVLVGFVDGRDAGRDELPVDVLLPAGLHRLHVPGVRYRRATVAPAEQTSVAGVPVTTLVRTAVDLTCWASSATQATVALDLMLAAGLGRAEPEGVDLHGRRGAVQARVAMARHGRVR